MYIEEDGMRLYAELELPEGAGEKCPLVIMVHGITGHCEEPHILAAARAARDCGYATLRADLYGHGKSDGEFRNHTLYKWLNNLLTLIDYARSLDFVTDLYLCGHSQGGLAVMLAAALKRDVIRGLIPLSPATMIPSGAREGRVLRYRFDPEHVPEAITSSEGMVLNGNYFRVAQSIHVKEAIARYRGPVLILHSDTDMTVPVRCAMEAAEAYQDCRLVILSRDTHCYDLHPEKMTEALAQWLTEHR